LPLTNKVELLTGVNDTSLRMQECNRSFTVPCSNCLRIPISFAPRQLIAGVKWRQLRGFNLHKRRSSRQICWVPCCRHWKRIRLAVKSRRRRATAASQRASINKFECFPMQCQSIDVSLRMHRMNDEHLINGKLMNFALRNFVW